MTATGICHMCSKIASVFYYRTPYSGNGKHDGYWHCEDHGPEELQPSLLEKMTVVAQAILENLPFTDDSFQPETVKDILPTLVDFIEKKKHTGMDWINSVYKAQSAGHPVHIDKMKDGGWVFHTMKSGTKKNLMDALSEAARSSVDGTLQIRDRDGRPLNRAARRARGVR